MGRWTGGVDVLDLGTGQELVLVVEAKPTVTLTASKNPSVSRFPRQLVPVL